MEPFIIECIVLLCKSQEKLKNSSKLIDLLLFNYRKFVLSHNTKGQSILFNWLLRIYLLSNNPKQARALILLTEPPDTHPLQ